MKTTHVDSNMRVPNAQVQKTLRWYSPQAPDFKLAGFAFGGKENGYRRLPLAAADILEHVNPAVRLLAENTSGGQLLFRTNSTTLAIRVKLRSAAVLCHMTATGQCGFDCYIEGEFYNAVKYDQMLSEYTFILFEGLAPEFRSVLLNFPLYCGVSELEIGLNADAAFAAPPGFCRDGRIVAYGTSITQGGCATRPGMSYTNQLSRMMGMEWINLGFSGNGNGELEIAELVASVENTRLFLVDYEANAGVNGIMEQTLDGILDAIRAKHPKTPILILSMIQMPRIVRNTQEHEKMLHRRDFMRGCAVKRAADGDENIWFLDGGELLGADWAECTVDGIHPSDLGFYQMAKTLRKPIETIIEGGTL